MLVEFGFVRAITPDGDEFSFSPSLGRIAALGSPHEIVATYARLHGPHAAEAAADVLAGLCDQDDPAALIGAPVPTGTPEAPGPVVWRGGAMPAAERVIIARHLMQHGICGLARPDATEARHTGGYRAEFRAAEFVAIARVHLGMSAADAEALSMTELQQLLDVKFPKKNDPRHRDVPTRDEYDALMARLMASRSGPTRPS